MKIIQSTDAASEYFCGLDGLLSGALVGSGDGDDVPTDDENPFSDDDIYDVSLQYIYLSFITIVYIGYRL